MRLANIQGTLINPQNVTYIEWDGQSLIIHFVGGIPESLTFTPEKNENPNQWIKELDRWGL